MKLKLVRDNQQPLRTFGKLYVDGLYFGETLEDTDRELEKNPGGKIYGTSAVPRGLYELVLSFSHRFGKILPEVLNVPGFSGIRIHGGNTEDDTLGCVLLGRVRDACGIHGCQDVNARLIDLLEIAAERGEKTTLEVA